MHRCFYPDCKQMAATYRVFCRGHSPVAYTPFFHDVMDLQVLAYMAPLTPAQFSELAEQLVFARLKLGNPSREIKDVVPHDAAR